MRKLLLIAAGVAVPAVLFVLPPAGFVTDGDDDGRARPAAGRPLPAAPAAAPASRPAALAALAGWRGTAPASGDGFRFVVLSDRTGGHVPGVWARAVEEVNRLRPDFVMSVGDYIEGYVRDEEELRRQWDEVDAITRRLEAPFFYCPGNHDVEGGPARAVYSELHAVGGKTYYAFDHGGCHFVVLDACLLPGRARRADAEAMLAWLADDLAAAADARHVFLFSHYPLYAERSWKRIRAMLDPARTTHFAGHWHAGSYVRAQGVDCHVLMATAAHDRRSSRKEGKFNAFAHVSVEAGRPRVAIIPVGAVKPHDLVKPDLPDDYFAPASAPAGGR